MGDVTSKQVHFEIGEVLRQKGGRERGKREKTTGPRGEGEISKNKPR